MDPKWTHTVTHIQAHQELDTHISEDHPKFDVREEAWPNADLDVRATCEGALIDGLPTDKIKAGDEREIQQMKDLQLYSWVKETDIHPGQIDLAHKLGSTNEGE